MTTRLVMRRPIESDMPPIIEHANDWEVARRLGRLPHPYGIVDARFFLDEVVPNELVWAITLRGEQRYRSHYARLLLDIGRPAEALPIAEAALTVQAAAS